ncbi:MAG: glycosyltransferase [Rhizobacter sp.]
MQTSGVNTLSRAAIALAEAQRQLVSGKLSDAENLIRRALALEPDNAQALGMLSGLALNAGYLDMAVKLAEQAVASPAAGHEAHSLLGMALHRRGDLLQAGVALRRAVGLQPQSAMLHLELGLVERALGRSRPALASFIRAFRLDPTEAQAQFHFVTMLDHEFRLGLRLPAPHVAPAEMPQPEKISVIVCSINDVKFERMAGTYARLLASVPHEIIRIPDAKSLCEGYNRGIEQSSGSVLVFSHDDIDILTPDFASRLLAHLRRHDLVGVVGTTRMAGLSWIGGGWPHGQGRVVHFDRSIGRYEMTVYRVAEASTSGVQAFDGLFFAARREALDRVRFDAQTFDGFHAYDIDFSFSAHLAGLHLAVCNDILIAHDSRGNFDERYRHYAEKFSLKHAGTLGSAQQGPGWPMAKVSLNTREAMTAFGDLHLALVTTSDLETLLLQLDARTPASAEPQTVWWTHLDSVSAKASEYHDSGDHGLLGLMGKSPQTSLEIGCGAGGLGARLKQLHPHARVLGIELNRAAAVHASARLDGVWEGRVEDFEPEALGLQPGAVDLLLLGDVLEHLYDPWRVMRRLRDLLAKDAEVLISIPNVRNMALLAETANGDWSYRSAGLLDITHIRFFTLREFRRLLAQTGFEMRRVEYMIDGRLTSLHEKHKGETGGIRAALGRMTVENLTAEDFREMCSIQFRIVAVRSDS